MGSSGKRTVHGDLITGLVTQVTFNMKCFIVVAAFVALACAQQTPDERRTELVNNAWDIASENGCFTRQTSQDVFNTLDGNGDKKGTQEEFVEVVAARLGNNPAPCLFNKAAATGGNPITIPDGVNKIFELWQPNGDCVSETNFKARATMLLKDCRWPEDENSL